MRLLVVCHVCEDMLFFRKSEVQPQVGEGRCKLRRIPGLNRRRLDDAGLRMVVLVYFQLTHVNKLFMLET